MRPVNLFLNAATAVVFLVTGLALAMLFLIAAAIPVGAAGEKAKCQDEAKRGWISQGELCQDDLKKATGLPARCYGGGRIIYAAVIDLEKPRFWPPGGKHSDPPIADPNTPGSGGWKAGHLVVSVAMIDRYVPRRKFFFNSNTQKSYITLEGHKSLFAKDGPARCVAVSWGQSTKVQALLSVTTGSESKALTIAPSFDRVKAGSNVPWRIGFFKGAYRCEKWTKRNSGFGAYWETRPWDTCVGLTVLYRPLNDDSLRDGKILAFSPAGKAFEVDLREHSPCGYGFVIEKGQKLDENAIREYCKKKVWLPVTHIVDVLKGDVE